MGWRGRDIDPGMSKVRVGLREVVDVFLVGSLLSYFTNILNKKKNGSMISLSFLKEATKDNGRASLLGFFTRVHQAPCN